MNQYYEYRHVVEFEETDAAGNAFSVSCLRWQGRCVEMFLLEYAPGVLTELRDELRMVTIAAGCDRSAPIRAHDEISVRLRLADMTRTQVSLAFDYCRLVAGGEQLVATGRLIVAFMRRNSAADVPDQLRLAPSCYAVRGRPAVLGTGGRAFSGTVTTHRNQEESTTCLQR